jgi:hypothetical protein
MMKKGFVGKDERVLLAIFLYEGLVVGYYDLEHS